MYFIVTQVPAGKSQRALSGIIANFADDFCDKAAVKTYL